jgi:hypothetical protein
MSFKMTYSTFGIDIKGKTKKFGIARDWVFAINHDLVEIDIPPSVRRVSCEHNHLKELKLPASVDMLSCDKELFDYDECVVKFVSIYYE